MIEEIYIPTYISIVKNTKYHPWDIDVIKFTILLKDDELNGKVIDFCYSQKEIELCGCSFINDLLIWHFKNNGILPGDYLKDTSQLIESDLMWNDYLAIRDIYYPENMKLPWYCNLH